MSIYKREEETYRNERARTYFLLGELYKAMMDVEEAEKWNGEAERLRRLILNKGSLPPGKEEDFDQLIMFWSR